MEGRADRQTGRQTDRQTDRQIDRQTDRQTIIDSCIQFARHTDEHRQRLMYEVCLAEILVLDLHDRLPDDVHNRTHAWLDCRCVSSSILEMASSDASLDQPQANAQQQTVRAFLSSLFGQLCAGQGSFSQTGLLQQPWVLASAARLIGDYAMWFSRLGGPEAPLEGALRLLLQAMLLSQVRLSQLRLSTTHSKHKSCLFGFPALSTQLCWLVVHV